MAKLMYDRISLITNMETMNRVTVIIDDAGNLVVKIDFHGMKCADACRIAKNIIAVVRVPFIFDVIHGYNHGTAIKEMLNNKLSNERIVDKRCTSWNPGETFLLIA